MRTVLTDKKQQNIFEYRLALMYKRVHNYFCVIYIF